MTSTSPRKPAAAVLAAAAAGIAGIAIGAAGLYAAQHYRPAAAPQRAAAAAAPAPGAETLGRRMVRIVPAEARPVRDTLRLEGRLALDGTRIQQVSARLAGRVDRIAVVEGDSVRAGDPVGWLYSPDFISAQNEFLLAKGTVRALDNATTADLLDDARATLASARNKLSILGASAADIDRLDRDGVVQQHLVVRAQAAGRVIKRNVDPGGYLGTGESLVGVADMSQLWFLGRVFESDLPRVRQGQAVDIRVAGAEPGAAPLRGRIAFVSPQVDPATHAVNVRVQLPNRGDLKPEMFAAAEVVLAERLLPVVPRAAVIQDGAESFIVVERAPDRFERVSVDTQPGNEAGQLAVTRGIHPGDRVVVDGSVLMDRGITDPQPGQPSANPLARSSSAERVPSAAPAGAAR